MIDLLSSQSGIFQAQYPQNFKKIENSNCLMRLAQKIYQFIHKKIGLFVLTSQLNPNKFDMQEGIEGHFKLESIGGSKIQFKTADNITLKGMHFIGQGCQEDSPTLILFNGSGLRYEEYGSQRFSNIRIFTVRNWLKMGVNVVVFNYRGVEFPGTTTKSNLTLDGDAAYKFTRNVLKVPENKILFHGHSLGGAIAAEVAALHPSVNLCIDRSFRELSLQVREMFKSRIPCGNLIGFFLSKVLIIFGWEYEVYRNWKLVRGHKWVVYHLNDLTIAAKARFESVIQKVDSKIVLLQMESQSFITKKGRRICEDSKLMTKPTRADIIMGGNSSHMRKLYGNEKKIYERQIEIIKGQ